MSLIEKQGSRKNQFTSGGGQKDLGLHMAQIHVFAKLPISIVLSQLQLQLSKHKYTFQSHQDYNQLISIIKVGNYRTLALIETSKSQGSQPQTIFPKYYKFQSTQSVKLITFPFKIIGSGLQNLSSQKDVLDLCSNYFNSKEGIKLCRVHMIRGSKDKKLESSKSLKKIITNMHYDKLFVFKDGENGLGIANDSANYNSIIEILEKQQKIETFRIYKDLESKETPSNRSKYLVLGDTTPKSMNIFQSLRKKKDLFDIMIMGKLQPNDYLLDENVVLATSDPVEHLNFLIDNGFDSNGIKTVMQNLISKKDNKNYGITKNQGEAHIPPDNIKNDKKQTVGTGQNVNQNITFTLNTEKAKVPQTQEVKSEISQKRKIKRIKSPKPSVLRQKEEERKVNISIVKVQKEENAIKQIQSNTIKETQSNDGIKETQQNAIIETIQNAIKEIQQNAINSKEEIIAINEIKPLIQPQPQSSNKTTRLVIENANSVNNSLNIQVPIQKVASITHLQTNSLPFSNNPKPDYKDLKNSPSYIIPEMSEEYRGSNLEPENSIKLIKHQSVFMPPSNEIVINYPQEGSMQKKIITINLNNQPAIYDSKSSQQIITESKIQPTQTYATGSSKNISITPINYTNTYSNGGNQVKVKIYEKNPQNEERKSKTIVYDINIDQSSGRPYKVIQPIDTINTSSVMKIEKENEQNNQFGEDKDSRLSHRKSQIKMVEIYEPMGSIGPEEIRIQNKSPSKSVEKSSLQNNSQKYVQQNFQKYNYPSQNGKDYYNVRTLNYHTINNEPYNNRIEISTWRTEETISNPVYEKPPIQNLQSRSIYRNNHQFPPTQTKVTRTIANNTGINLNDYQPIQRNGITVYMRKVPIIKKYSENNPLKVHKYEATSLRRDVPLNYQQVYNYTYKRPSVIRDNTVVETTPLHAASKPNSKIQIVSNTFGEMIQSSLEKNPSRDHSELSYKGERIQNDSIKKKLYEIRQPRVEVEMIEIMEPKVQAVSYSHHNIMNQSNTNSKISEMHSDGSILRRNNIKFGIKPKKAQQKSEFAASMTESKNASGVYGLNNLNKKMALNRIISGQGYLQEEKEKYRCIITKFNCFHFIITEEMSYLIEIINRFIATSNDTIQSFTGSEELYECIRQQKIYDRYDVGLIFVKKEQVAYFNTGVFPDQYYFVEIDGEREQMLQINQLNKRIKMDQMWHLPLAQKKLIDSQLYQYVIYHSDKPYVSHVADQFQNSEFILQKIETDFSCQILDCYYCQLPRLVRLYVLCAKQQLFNLQNIASIYEELNPNFQKQSCKLICILSNCIMDDELIRSNPTVTFISNQKQLKSYHDVIQNAHNEQKQTIKSFPIDQVFYHQKHEHLGKKIRQEFPGRFLTIPYSQVAEVNSKIDKSAQITARSKYNQKNYLILHQSVNGEKVQMQKFAKVYMLGRVKIVQNKVIRVMDESQLFQLLRK